MTETAGMADAAIEAIIRLRRHGAAVHCIANTVAQPLVANILLACGATPSMTVSPQEVGEFVRRSQALAINLGTMDDQRRNACLVATRVAGEAGIPFVLDPVMCHLSDARLQFALELLGRHPAILRTNSLEADAIGEGAATATCHIVTGPIDRIVSNGSVRQISNGDPLLASTIATGCSHGALMAALLVHAEEPVVAAIAASAWFGVAGEIAAGKCHGPGSFPAAFLDALWEVSPRTLAARMKLS